MSNIQNKILTVSQIRFDESDKINKLISIWDKCCDKLKVGFQIHEIPKSKYVILPENQVYIKNVVAIFFPSVITNIIAEYDVVISLKKCFSCNLILNNYIAYIPGKLLYKNEYVFFHFTCLRQYILKDCAIYAQLSRFIFELN